MLSARGTSARLVPAPRRAPSLDVEGEGSEHFLGGEVGAAHNQAMSIPEKHVHAGLGAVVPHVRNHRAVEVGGADLLAAHGLEEGPRRLHVLLEGAELNPNLLDGAEPQPSQGRRHGNLAPEALERTKVLPVKKAMSGCTAAGPASRPADSQLLYSGNRCPRLSSRRGDRPEGKSGFGTGYGGAHSKRSANTISHS